MDCTSPVAFVAHYSSGAATDSHRFPVHRFKKYAKNLICVGQDNETNFKKQGKF